MMAIAICHRRLLQGAANGECDYFFSGATFSLYIVCDADLEMRNPDTPLSLLPMQPSGVPAGQRQVFMHHAP